MARRPLHELSVGVLLLQQGFVTVTRFRPCSMREERSTRAASGIMPATELALQQWFHVSDYRPRAALIAQRSRPTPPEPRSVVTSNQARDVDDWPEAVTRQVPTTWLADLGHRSTPANRRQYALVSSQGVVAQPPMERGTLRAACLSCIAADSSPDLGHFPASRGRVSGPRVRFRRRR